MSGVLIIKLFILSFAVINALLLIIKGDEGKVRNYFLGWAFLFYCLYFMVFILWYEMGFILNYPHLMRTGSALGFLVAPFFYFFVRNNTLGKVGFQKMDWLHFLPAFIHILELIPLFILSGAEKLAIAEQVLINPAQLNMLARGIINPEVINAAKLASIIFYFGFCCVLWTQANSYNWPEWKLSGSKNWIFLSLVLVGGINFGYFIYRISFFVENSGGVSLGNLQSYSSYIILTCVGLLSTYIHFNPRGVFESDRNARNEVVDLEEAALNEEEYKVKGETKDIESEQVHSDSRIQWDENLRLRIISLFEDEMIFRQQGLMVADFAKKIGVPARDLPLYFRLYFDSDFKTMANDYRICLAKKMIEDGYLDDFTLEALGEHCGFRSRTTLFNAFKKKYGKSPSDFWKVFQNNEL